MASNFMIDLKAMGRRIASVRTLRGKLQKEMAEVLGVSQATYSNYERGNIMMGIDKFALLIDYLEVDADWLLGLPSGEGMGPF